MMMIRATFFAALAAIGLFMSAHAGAQTQPGGAPNPVAPAALPKTTALDDVVAVNARREQLARQYTRVEQDLADLTSQRETLPADTNIIKRFLDDTKSEADSLRKRIEEAKKRAAPDPEKISQLETELDRTQRRESSTQSDLDRAAELETKIKLKREEREGLATEIASVDRRLAELVNFEKERNSFRKLISAVFCALVGIVIGGFFYVTRTGEIAQTIFSGEKGIQFITLFLVILAIILFGILGILEGKELAALLGAISGYILGRASTQVEAPGTT